MDTRRFDEALRSTLEDRRLTRSEKKAVRGVLEELSPRPEQLAELRSRAFAIAREELVAPEALRILDWLEDVVRTLQPAAPTGTVAQAHFSPDDDCPHVIAGLIRHARRRADICVFTITDDRISSAILDAHRRGVALRVLTDNDKALDRGSDIQRLADAGVEVRVDESEHHMHHKFAVLDGEQLLTGSYNWTRGAAEHNEENLLVTDDRRLVRLYVQAFERLWQRFAP